jgi:hypothetical protein
MKRAIFFVVLAALLLVPWAVGYAHDRVSAANIDMTIVPADPALKPNMHVFGNAIGSITAGDLFMIDTSGTSGNTTFNLAISNIDELTHTYRYLMMVIGIYVQTNTNTWEKISDIDGELNPDRLLTMQNGSVNFKITGAAKYKVTVESGSYRSFHFAEGQRAAIPQVYLTTS